MSRFLFEQHTAFWLTYIFWVALQIAIGRNDHKFTNVSKFDKGSRFAIMAGLLAGVLLAYKASFWFPLSNISLSENVQWVGLILAATGLLFHFWAIKTLGKYFRTVVIIQKDHQLISHGPYRFLRNPSYTASIFIMLGMGLMLNNWWSVFFAVLFPIPAFIWRIIAEEQALHDNFGETYMEYRKKRWALLPFIW